MAFTRALKKYGKENFKREILYYCDNLNNMITKEAEYVDENWVNDPTTYNLQTGGLQYGILNKDSKKQISQTLKDKYASGYRSWNKGLKLGPLSKDHKTKISNSLKERYQICDHPTLGKEPWNKGLTGVQTPWNKGLKLGPQTPESNEKRSKTLKNRYKTQEHHRKGKEPWNKGLTGVQTPWNKGKPADRFQCPHCQKIIGGKSNFLRWHNNNCKFAPKS